MRSAGQIVALLKAGLIYHHRYCHHQESAIAAAFSFSATLSVCVVEASDSVRDNNQTHLFRPPPLAKPTVAQIMSA